MPISKVCSRCGKIVPTGTTCSCVQKKNRERHKLYNATQRDKAASTFYNSYAWQQCRKRIIEADGCDVYMYMTQGIIIPADTVHHIVPLRDDWSRRLSRENLMPIAAGTHNTIEYMYEQDKPGMIRLLTKMLAEYRRGHRGASESF